MTRGFFFKPHRGTITSYFFPVPLARNLSAEKLDALFAAENGASDKDYFLYKDAEVTSWLKKHPTQSILILYLKCIVKKWLLDQNIKDVGQPFLPDGINAGKISQVKLIHHLFCCKTNQHLAVFSCPVLLSCKSKRSNLYRHPRTTRIRRRPLVC